ncbi:thiopeptide-type bacteriocin biosynthesis protein [Streptomyces sp. NRRL S-118]|uniref:thiopeptide-type bacteriocin biosynthesis protein n=1 Tax=Streptomyces sp. NRRL S-118 TaxID=1463881 RepID=UPI0007C6FB62|nr:thiopeptide-type bacteriocin biosynthesis protein [Streptomyces sp. NRRL S-118]
MLEVERLLADCLHDARAGSLGTVPLVPYGSAYAAARRAFLAAGLQALRDDLPEAGWVQLDLAPEAFAWPRLYGRLAEAADDLVGTGLARDFFFMHKPPGLRVRFHASEPSRAGELRAALTRHFERRREDGGWARPYAGVYEPETYLFGGPRSMPYVHGLFTADARAWLDVHTAASGSPVPPEWRVSLMLLRTAFDALGIAGWEHRGVWQVVREETGRRLADGLHGGARQRAAAGIRAYFEQSADAQLDALPKDWQDVLRVHRAAARRAAARWRAGYFESGEATVGPRRAAAYHVIFHWNRGRFSAARQCLITEALAADASAESQESPAGAGSPERPESAGSAEAEGAGSAGAGRSIAGAEGRG